MSDEKKLTDVELKQAFFILRHGSAEGRSAYISAVLAIENEYNRQKAEIERLTEEKNDWGKSCRMWSEANKKNHLNFTKTLEKLCEERNKNAELQKRVDEANATLGLFGRKHFCNDCKIAYVYSPKALKKTHCEECGRPLTGFVVSFESTRKDDDDEEGNE